MGLKFKLSLLSFLQFAVWGAYLTSMGRYLGNVGLGQNVGYFYAMQGIVSLFMPALMGVVADRWVNPVRLFGLLHLFAGIFMLCLGFYGYACGGDASFGVMISIFTLSLAFFTPTLSLSYSVPYGLLHSAGIDLVAAFPSIRMWGTIGFIVSMCFTDIMGFQVNQNQFLCSGILGILLFFFTFSLPRVENVGNKQRTLRELLGIDALHILRRREILVFFCFSVLMGICVQISNGFANPFIASFAAQPEFAGTFGVEHTNILLALARVSETLCILLIPFFMRRYGIKVVVILSMLSWSLLYFLYSGGNPGDRLWMFVMAMIVYGMAFDFFNIAGSLYVDSQADANVRNSVQGLYTLMVSGLGTILGSVVAQRIVNAYTHSEMSGGNIYIVGDWSSCWHFFSLFALVIAIAFALLFHPKK